MRDYIVKWLITLTIFFGVPLAMLWALMPLLDISHATFLAAQGDYQKALHTINRAVAFNGGLASVYTRRGWLYDKLQSYDKALADFNRAIAISDVEWEPFNNRAWLLTHMPGADLKQAQSDANRAVDLCPDCAAAYDTRGYVELQLDQMPSALADFEQALSLNHKLGEAYLHRGQYYDKIGDRSRAESDRLKAREYGCFE
jgi:tetratricopeptide (TPR) repeat protein